MRKYNNKITYVGDIRFDSGKEAKRYCELSMLEKVGEIKDLKLQPRFLLLDNKDSNGKVIKFKGRQIRQINYTADFQYFNVKTGQTIVEDVKGMRTRDYVMRMKMFLVKYPEYKFIET